MDEKEIKQYPQDEIISLLSELAQISGSMNFGLSLKELLDNFLERILDIIGVEAVTLFVIESRMLLPKSIIGEHKDILTRLLAGQRIFIGQGIVGWAADMNRPVIVNEPYNHPRFLQEFDKKSGFVSLNILCVQVIIDGKIRGVVELLNKRKGGFDEVDANFVKVIAAIIGNAIKNDEYLQESQKWKNYYELILKNIPSGFIGVSLDKKVLFFNHAAGQILGLVDSEMPGKKFEEAFSRFPALIKILNSILITKSTVNRQEAEVIKSNGEKILMGYGSIILKDQAESIAGYGLIFQDITRPPGV